MYWNPAPLIFCGILLGYLYGWSHAHHTIATECERLGKFYVGKTVYECKSIGGKE